MISLHLPLADVISAFNGINGLLVGFLAAVFTTALILAGYAYMFALDDHTKASQAKRAVGNAVVGAVLIALAGGLAVAVVKSIGH